MSESSTTTLFISKLGFNLCSEFPAARSLSFGTSRRKNASSRADHDAQAHPRHVERCPSHDTVSELSDALQPPPRSYRPRRRNCRDLWQKAKGHSEVVPFWRAAARLCKASQRMSG